MFVSRFNDAKFLTLYGVQNWWMIWRQSAINWQKQWCRLQETEEEMFQTILAKD